MEFGNLPQEPQGASGSLRGDCRPSGSVYTSPPCLWQAIGEPNRIDLKLRNDEAGSSLTHRSRGVHASIKYYHLGKTMEVHNMVK